MSTPRRTTALLLACLVLVGCSRSGPSPTAAASATPTPRIADLDVLARALARHPEPPDVAAQISDLRSRAEDLDDDQWLVELMRLTATRERDGHTGLFPLAQPSLKLWPLQLYAFTDGWRVVAAQPPYEQLVGAAVTEVGGLPVEQAVEWVTPLVPHDNATTIRARVAQLLVVPAVLNGLGLDRSLVVGGRKLTPEPVPVSAYADLTGSFYPLVVPRLPPVPEVDLQLTFSGREARLDYHRVTAGSGGTSILDIAAELERRSEAGELDRVVVDLRRNSGGENGSYPPLLAALQKVEQNQPGSVRLLIGRTTFSAATNFVAEVLASTDARTFGETMGGAPNMWGDARETVLPGSGLTVHVATRLWELGGKDLRPAIEPDVPVDLSAADWLAGRDPVLAAASRP